MMELTTGHATTEMGIDDKRCDIQRWELIVKIGYMEIITYGRR